MLTSRTIRLFFCGWFGLSTGVPDHPAQADCWQDAETRFAVSRYLLLAIAENESGLNPLAVNHNPDGTLDYGLMQINSRWLPVLAAQGIDSDALMNPCTNLEVGAWILAGNFARYGRNWRAVGAYNAREEALRKRYAWQVARKFNSIAKEYGLEAHDISH